MMRKNNVLLSTLGVLLLMGITPGFAAQPTDVPKREKSVKEMAAEREALVQQTQKIPEKRPFLKNKTLKDDEWIGKGGSILTEKKQERRLERREAKKARKKEKAEKKGKAAESQAAESPSE